MNAALLRSLNYMRSAFTSLIHLPGVSHLPVTGQFMSLYSLRVFCYCSGFYSLPFSHTVYKEPHFGGGAFHKKTP